MLNVVIKSFKGLSDVIPIMNYPTKGILTTIAGVTASIVTIDTVKSYHELERLEEVTKQITIQEETKRITAEETTKQTSMQESTKQLEIQSRRWYQFWR